ncbi:hypothetical protein J5N97_001993 [Dioscorea zingiberensis]|uniref:Uncharacterized protein n=1 Tax=Dioscorea zingiberensis TaxID=325984 RepID=A0A9D5H333_9LILI|nr:hypothetical protein J5N97_001993 [Dioscorea zingiberensis]
MAEKARQHYLFVTYPVQSHINPTLHLAKHLASTTGAAVTFSTAVSAHRRMVSSFPNADQEFNNGLITYLPFSDGNDEGFKRDNMDLKEHISDFRKNGQRNVSTIVGDLAAAGRPVTCIVYTLLLTWAVDVAEEHGIPSVLYWIQPATVFAIYYHFFHGFESIVRSHEPSFTVYFPELQPLQIRDLPSYVNVPVTDIDSFNATILNSFRDLFEILDREQETRVKPRVLMYTFEAWETEALASVTDIEIIPVGQWPNNTGYPFKEDEKKYMEWLDTKVEGSVVYISFGSLSVMKKEQKEEMVRGLKESKRPFLWVVRKDNREEGEGVLEIEGEDAMVVEWCSQGQRNVSTIVGDLAAAGRPVTYIVYSLLLNWVVDVAEEHGIPSVLYWIQPATVFAIYYHYFHGFESIVRAHADEPSFTVSFPELQPLQIRDLPSFLNVPVTDTDSFNASIHNSFKELFEILDRGQEDKVKPRVLVNTFEAWETEALASVTEIDIIPVGQWPKESNTSYLFKEDEKKYMEWLDTKEEGSVVYISFGSLSVMKKEQKEEMLRGLKESKKPFLWVVRKDNREEGWVVSEELVRCLELVMGDGEKGVEIRNKAKTWREKALEAVAGGGSCVVNLKAFVDKFL